MNRSQLIAKVEKRWKEFTDSFTRLTDEQITQAGTMGQWSLKDMLGHVTTWEEELLKYLPTILAGKTTPRYKNKYGGIDAFNALMVEEKRGLPLDEIRKQLEETHARVITFLKTVPEEHFVKENRFRKRVRLDSYGHYKEHTQAIRAAF